MNRGSRGIVYSILPISQEPSQPSPFMDKLSVLVGEMRRLVEIFFPFVAFYPLLYPETGGPREEILFEETGWEREQQVSLLGFPLCLCRKYRVATISHVKATTRILYFSSSCGFFL